MRIGLDALPLTTPRTGVGHYTFELALALARLEPATRFELLYPTSYAPLSIPDGVMPANLQLERVRVGPVGRHWWSVGLPRHLRGNHFDVFHGTNYDVPFWRQCATVLTIHDLSLLLHPETHTVRSVRRARRRLPLMLLTADAIITPTESVRGELVEHFKVDSVKVTAIPEAARECFQPMDFAATAAVRLRLGVDDEFLLAVGTIEPRKNLAILVSAFADIARTRPGGNLQLVIAGGAGWLSSPLLESIRHSPVRDRILLTDYLHDEDLRALYASCRAFIYPSIYEGFGLPPLEAMACGAPVIASNIPSLAETTAGGASLFNPRDISDLAENIIRLLDDEDGRRKLLSAGRRRAAELSWEKSATETLKVYQQALDRYRG